MTAVALTGIGVAYDGIAVVHDVDLEVGPGEWLGLIGPNGAGKTTVLKAIAGMVSATGAITMDGAAAPGPGRERARTVALVPQTPAIPQGMSVTDYVLLGRTPHLGLLASESDRDLSVVARALDMLDLNDLAGRRIDTLSGGELQRAILARAFAQEAPVLLLDEPTAALDLGHQQEVFRLIDRLRADRELAVISAVHDLTLAARFCDRVILLDGGAVVAAGSPRQVITEQNVARHFHADVRVLDHADLGLLVVPMPSGNGHAERHADQVADDAADQSDGEVLEP